MYLFLSDKSAKLNLDSSTQYHLDVFESMINFGWTKLLYNFFIFIRGLSCPSKDSNCLKLTIPGFSYNCLPESCGDIGLINKILGLILAWKSCLKVPSLPWRPSCPLETLLLSDLVWCDSPLQIIMAVWCSVPNSHYYLQQAVTLNPAILNLKKCAPNGHCYLQRAVTHNWMDSIALWEHIKEFFSRTEKPSEDMNSLFFRWIRKGWVNLDPLHTRSSLQESQLNTRLKKLFLGWIIEHSGENIWWRLWVRRMLFSCKISLLQKGWENSVY